MPLSTLSTLTPSPEAESVGDSVERSSASAEVNEGESGGDFEVRLQAIFGLCQDTLTLVKKIDTR